MRTIMNFGLVLATIVGIVMGANALGEARSAVHEIEGFICFLIATVGVAGLAIGAAIDDVVRRLPEPAKVVVVEKPTEAAK